MQLSGSRGHEIVDQRRVRALEASREQALARAPIAFGHVDEPARQFAARTPDPEFGYGRAKIARRPPDSRKHPHEHINHDEREDQARHRHLDDVAPEVDQHVTVVLQQKVRGERADEQGRNAPKPVAHQSPSAASARSRSSEPLISGRGGATSSSASSSSSVIALFTAPLAASKSLSSSVRAASRPV